MNEISEAMIMNYVDGGLDADQSSFVEREAEHRPELRAMIAAFAATRPDAEIWRVFDQPMREPVPRHLVDFVMSSGQRAAPTTLPLSTGRKSSWTAMLDNIRGLLLPDRGSWGSALAYSAMLAIGVSAGWVLHGAKGPGAGVDIAAAELGRGLTADAGLNAILEAVPSGQRAGSPLHAGSQWRVTPVLTFQAKNGAYCREYKMALESSPPIASGLACRAPSGQWIVQAHEAIDGSVSAPGGAYQKAGKNTAQSVDAAFTKLRSGDVLGAPAEAESIAKGWKSKPH